MKKSPRLNGLLFYLILMSGILLLATWLNGSFASGKPLSYSEILKLVQTDRVKSVEITGNTVEVRLKDSAPVPAESAPRSFLPGLSTSDPRTIKKTISPYWMQDFLVDLKAASEKQGFTFDYTEPINFSGWINGVMMLLLILSMGFLFYFAYIRQNGEGKNTFNFGKSRATAFDPSRNPVTFRDVAGVDEEKHELQEIVDFLKNPQKYSDLGARIPRGILLVGPPGTGKTLLAKAVAGEAGVPFFSISGSNFVEMFVGVGASRVRDLFLEAKKHHSAIVFIDEIDAVGRHRGAGMGGGHDEREQTLNQLLVEMDGFSPNENVIVMAATNRPDILDPALLRPGRFDRKVTVRRPDLEGRTAILEVHRKGKPLDPSIDLREIARTTPGFTGADLANLLNEAALLCARRNGRAIAYHDIAEAVFKVMVGPEKKSRVMNARERQLTAYHEAGHAIVLRSTSQTDRVERVSIIPAGDAGGYTAHKPFEDRYYYTHRMLLEEIRIALGGRAAEEILYGEVTTGASGDLQHCNAIARDIVCKYGMSDRLQNLVFGGGGEVFLGKEYGHVQNYSDSVAAQIDAEVQRIITEAYDSVLALLRDKWEAVRAVAERLIAEEKIDGAEFERLYRAHTTAEQRAGDPENPFVREWEKGEAAAVETAAGTESVASAGAVPSGEGPLSAAVPVAGEPTPAQTEPVPPAPTADTGTAEDPNRPAE